MGRTTFILLTFLFFIKTQAFAGTQSTEIYTNDINHDPNFIFGLIDFNAEAPDYKDPNFEDGIQLPSPLYNPTYSSYDIVVVANKTDKLLNENLSEKGQTVRVYIREAALFSLNPEQLKHIESYHPETGLLYYWTSSTAKPSKTTPSGYYTIQGFSSDHHSSIYNSAPMPWTVFFNEDIATHGVLGSALKNLGTPLSAGCVRLEPQRARELFHLIGNIGKGPVDLLNQKTGTPIKNTDDTLVKKERYKTLIIVKD